MALLMDSSDSEDEQITNESNHSEEVLLKKYIADYLSEKHIDSDADPLLWWKTNKKYAFLSDIARQLLCIPPISVSSE